MNAHIAFLSVAFLILLSQHVHAEETTATRQLDTFARLSGIRPNTTNGREFFLTRHNREWSCSTCHTTDPTVLGKHVQTGEVIQPMAPVANASRFTDASKSEKWFRRNCNDVIGRECTPEEKADVMAWLLSLKAPTP